MDKFGGHPMAAGLSLKHENISKLRERLNANCTLTSEDLDPVLWIDVPMPLSYVNIGLVEELGRLEPFGKGNEKPLFADKNLLVRGVSIIGKNSNVLKMQSETDVGSIADAICFSFDPDNVPKKDNVISVVYYPDINEYKGRKRLQFIVKEWRRQDV